MRAIVRSTLVERPLFVAAAAAYVGLRVWSFWPAVDRGAPFVFPDSAGYEHTGSLSLASSGFWAGWNPVGWPLFFKLMPNPTVLVRVQLAIAVVAWLVLATVVASMLRHRWLQLVAFVLVLGFSTAWEIAQWDGSLLTESLTLSLAALLVAGLLLFSSDTNWWNATFVLVLAVLFGATRDANAYLTVLLAVPVAAVAARRALLPACAVMAGTLAIAGAVYALSGVERYEIPLRDVIALRVLPDPAMKAYFVARGMPVVPDETDLLYRVQPPDPSPFVDNPQLAPVHTWLLAHGESTFDSYLASHPSASIATPLEEVGEMVGPSTSPELLTVTKNNAFLPNMRQYATTSYRKHLAALQDIAYPGTGWIAFSCMLVALGILAFVGRSRPAGRRASWAVPVVCIVSILPWSLLIWDATPLEIARHALLIGVLGRLGLWLALLFAANALTEQPDVVLSPKFRAKPEPDERQRGRSGIPPYGTRLL